MDVSQFMGGNWLRHADLPAPQQVWTIASVTQEQLGNDQKIVVRFQEHQKGLGLNKTNLRVIANAFGTNSEAWIGQRLELYQDQTHFQGQMMPCIRVRIPAPAAAPQPQPAVQPPTPPAPQPVAAPQPQAPVNAKAASSVWAGTSPQQ